MGDTQRGNIQIADSVVGVIAGIAAQEIDGVTLRSAGLYQEFANKIGGAQSAKGVQVNMADDVVTLELRIGVRYGLPIHRVCRELQQLVKEKVEIYTGLLVDAVHIRVEHVEWKP